MSDYQRGYEAARLDAYFGSSSHKSAVRSGQQLGQLALGFFLVSGWGLFEMILVAPFWLFSCWLTAQFSVTGSKFYLLSAIGALLLLALIHILRGVATAARSGGNNWALLILGFCWLLCCAGPGLAAGLLIDWLCDSVLWTWIAGLITSLVAVHRYKVGYTNGLFGRCYQFGYQAAARLMHR